MMISAPSNRPEFSGFGDFYAKEVAPYLSGKERHRKAAVHQAGGICVVTGIVVLMIVQFGPDAELNRHLAVAAGMIGALVAGARVKSARNNITHGLLERICGHFGYAYRRELSRPAYFEPFKRLKLMPSFNREAWEDEVVGARNGADFTLCEAHLRYRSSGKNSSTRTVFHGLILVVDYHKAFLGETVVKRDRGVFNRLMKPGKGFSRVGIASPEFEKIFEAWSTDQVEARDLLDPIVLERFKELDRLFKGDSLRAAFSGEKLYIAVETGDRLNMGSMFKPLAGPERVETILKELDVVFDLIDVLVKRVDGRIDGPFSLSDVKATS